MIYLKKKNLLIGGKYLISINSRNTANLAGKLRVIINSNQSKNKCYPNESQSLFLFNLRIPSEPKF